jgi:hypothetical protein
MSPGAQAITGKKTTRRCWLSGEAAASQRLRLDGQSKDSLPIPDSDNGRICWNIVDYLCL